MKKNKNETKIIFGPHNLTIEDIMCISQNNATVGFTQEDVFWENINKGVKFIDKLLEEEGVIYGVTTGYGDSCVRSVPTRLIHKLPINLSRFHGCGLGDFFTREQSRAILAVRLCSLAKGFSGVSPELLKRLMFLLNEDICPIIPEEGSVGASGDLTPLSYLAGVLIGEREVYYKGKKKETRVVYNNLKLKPIVFRPKEALAIMNGTAVMTAIACEAYQRSNYLVKLASRLTAMASLALRGNVFHFDKKLFDVKPHPGQKLVASWIRSDLEHKEMPRNSSRLQDRYSLRCAPHVIGVLQDSMDWFRNMIENELNSSNDNPIVDAEGEHIMHGGHFYGGHIASVMDTMKTQVANLADLLDRQMALLMDSKFNNGLPDNVSFAKGDSQSINHGFKAVQIGVSAWTAEALKMTIPASIFSRSTECHNQDKVSMGTIAARDCIRVLELTEQVFAAHLLAVTQAIIIRLERKELEKKHLSNPLAHMIIDILSDFTIVEEDRPLDTDLRHFVKLIRSQKWDLYEVDNI